MDGFTAWTRMGKDRELPLPCLDEVFCCLKSFFNIGLELAKNFTISEIIYLFLLSIVQ